ncbi:MAG: hypothetical protein J5I59_06615 [Saprospiraceae bacterium]|nr:hypothetical protein [Saprospiraceae bacterium]
MSNQNELQFIGIRHHGPGCARDLDNFLNEFNPNLILIEFPENIGEFIREADLSDICPPVGILLFKPGVQKINFVLPLAKFSPEWIALKYAKFHRIPIEPIDFPLGSTPVPTVKEEKEASETLPIKNTGEAFAYLSKLQGVEDVEHWWEINFEQTTDPIGNFRKIEEVIMSIQPAIEAGSDHLTRVREAFMRLKIRQYLKSGKYQKIAVITGAAHLPFVKNYSEYSIKEDKALIRTSAKEKLTATWIPWTYKRLSSLDDYGAGIEYPKYYEHIFDYGASAPITITSALSVYLRGQGYDISLAHTLESVNLARTLGNLRGWDIPGIDTIIEACVAVYNLDQLSDPENIIKEAFIGNDLGSVPLNLQNQALINDFENSTKACKLSKYMVDNQSYELILDLRDPVQLEASKLLWRVQLLGINWGKEAYPTRSTKGTFNEFWDLQWEAEYLITLFHQCVYGSDIQSATLTKISGELSGKIKVDQLLHLIKPIVNAGIDTLTENFLNRIENTIFKIEEYRPWMELIPQLCSFRIYGSVRALDLTSIRTLIELLVQRLSANLFSILISVSEENMEDLLESLLRLNRSLKKLEDESIYQTWLQAIFAISDNHLVPSIFRGWMTGICLENKQIQLQDALTSMSFELSDLDDINSSASWLQGILQSQVLSPFAVPAITRIIDMWLTNIEYERFRTILPALRKAFSNVSASMKESFKMHTGKQKPALDDEKTTRGIHPELLNVLQGYINTFSQ